jgi:hypothetical protein
VNTNLTDFQRSFRQAREAADRGESVILEGEGRRYVFEIAAESRNPFEGLKNVFGAVKLGQKNGTHRQRIRARLAEKRCR